MADVKLGSKAFAGIKIVSMNTPDGGKQTFSSGGGSKVSYTCSANRPDIGYTVNSSNTVSYTCSVEIIES